MNHVPTRKLKARRKELKLTQKEIAEELGISFQAYSAWERGIKEPSKEKVTQLEKILKVAKGYFTQIEIVRLYNSLSKQGEGKGCSLCSQSGSRRTSPEGCGYVKTTLRVSCL